MRQLIAKFPRSSRGRAGRTMALFAGLPARHRRPCRPHALQVVEASDGVAVEAILSIKEPTRIRIEGAPITDVFGNIHSSHCGGGAAHARHDGAAGRRVPRRSIRPARSCWSATATRARSTSARSATPAKPVNLFVSSAHATYTLLLRRADTPADTIVIRDKTPKGLRATVPSTASGARRPTTSAR
jgi:conjugal transfer pilus assembly protein TraK